MSHTRRERPGSPVVTHHRGSGREPETDRITPMWHPITPSAAGTGPVPGIVLRPDRPGVTANRSRPLGETGAEPVAVQVEIDFRPDVGPTSRYRETIQLRCRHRQPVRRTTALRGRRQPPPGPMTLPERVFRTPRHKPGTPARQPGQPRRTPEPDDVTNPAPQYDNHVKDPSADRSADTGASTGATGSITDDSTTPSTITNEYRTPTGLGGRP